MYTREILGIPGRFGINILGKLRVLYILEGTAGQLLASAEGFGPWPRVVLPFLCRPEVT